MFCRRPAWTKSGETTSAARRPGDTASKPSWSGRQKKLQIDAAVNPFRNFRLPRAAALGYSLPLLAGPVSMNKKRFRSSDRESRTQHFGLVCGESDILARFDQNIQ
jgi:hypothetical protein